MAINLFVASGNVGKDCVQRTTNSGKVVASFSLPVKQGFGEHEKVSWVTCKLLGAKAEKLPQYITKGTKLTVSGEFVLEEWQGQNGEQNKMPVIIVRDLDFGSAAQQGVNQGGQQSQQQQQWQQQQQSAPQQAQQQASQQQNGFQQQGQPQFDPMADIPFMRPFCKPYELYVL